MKQNGDKSIAEGPERKKEHKKIGEKVDNHPGGPFQYVRAYLRGHLTARIPERQRAPGIQKIRIKLFIIAGAVIKPEFQNQHCQEQAKIKAVVPDPFLNSDQFCPPTAT